ncbi:MAG: diacylglycerol kinase family lipid kinase [Chloroflexota bacterium]|nr:diacylglycerol kinase family lipid kinase [Chloroflexota bacterium]MDQ5867887.1 diacylglycerol kinase family lipid kinase [Chloroflexota bacterium]
MVQLVKQQEDETQQETPNDGITPLLEGQEAYAPEEVNDNIPPGTKVAVIINPAAGKKGGITTNTAGVDDVRRVLEANGIQADFLETQYPNHATELAQQALKEKYDIVIACGGDGTVGEVATALIGRKITLGILPLGSANNVARMMHVPFDLEEAAKVLRLGEIKKVDAGRCNGTYFLETAGVGLDAAIFPILNKVDKGEYVRLFDALTTFFKFRPRSVTVVLDGRAIRIKALVVLVANGPYWGYSVPLAPDAKVDDRRFDVVIFRNFSKWSFVRHVLRALLHRADPRRLRGHGRHSLNGKQITLGSNAGHPDVRVYQAKKVQVLTSRRRPWPVHADALPRGFTPATINLIPGALRVITGPGEHATAEPSKGTPKGTPPDHRLKDS